VPVALGLERTAGAGISSREMKLLKNLLRRIFRNLAAPRGGR
jgi:hypothetical protein